MFAFRDDAVRLCHAMALILLRFFLYDSIRFRHTEVSRKFWFMSHLRHQCPSLRSLCPSACSDVAMLKVVAI